MHANMDTHILTFSAHKLL